MNEINAPMKEAPESFLPLPPGLLVRTQPEDGHLTKKQALTRQGMCWHLDLGCLSLWNCEKICCLNHPAYVIFVTGDRMDKDNQVAGEDRRYDVGVVNEKIRRGGSVREDEEGMC